MSLSSALRKMLGLEEPPSDAVAVERFRKWRAAIHANRNAATASIGLAVKSTRDLKRSEEHIDAVREKQQKDLDGSQSRLREIEAGWLNQFRRG